MINVFKSIILIQLLLVVIPVSAAIQDESLFKISFTGIGIADVYSLSDLDWAVSTSPPSAATADELLFQQYWTIQSFEQYKALFRPNEAPAISEEEFRAWSQTNASASILVRGKVMLEISGYKLSVIQFAMGAGGAMQDNSFLVKKVGDSWFPVSSSENKKFHELKLCFSVVKPEGLGKLFDLDGFETSPVLEPEELSKFKSTLITGNVLDGTLLLSELQEAFYLSSETADRAYLKLTYLYKPEAARALSEEDMKMKAYLDSLSISGNDQKRILTLIRNNLYVEAASAIKEAKSAPSSHPYVLKIREIYGEDKIRIYDSRENQWR